MNIGYFRVSKEDETIQDLDLQIQKVKEKFNLKDLIVYKERGSAYDLEKIHKRTEFKRLLNFIFDSENVTIEDLFFNKIKIKEQINLYVWDYSRIIRNMELNILFSLLSDKFNIEIISYKQTAIKKRIDETPTEKMLRMMMTTIQAFSSEEYSYNISTNVKKVVETRKGITYSNKGNKWGRKLKNSSGVYVDIGLDKQLEMNAFILKKIHYHSYPKVITMVIKEFDIKLSKGYISKLKNEKI